MLYHTASLIEMIRGLTGKGPREGGSDSAGLKGEVGFRREPRKGRYFVRRTGTELTDERFSIIWYGDWRIVPSKGPALINQFGFKMLG